MSTNKLNEKEINEYITTLESGEDSYSSDEYETDDEYENQEENITPNLTNSIRERLLISLNSSGNSYFNINENNNNGVIDVQSPIDINSLPIIFEDNVVILPQNN